MPGDCPVPRPTVRGRTGRGRDRGRRVPPAWEWLRLVWVCWLVWLVCWAGSVACQLCVGIDPPPLCRFEGAAVAVGAASAVAGARTPAGRIMAAMSVTARTSRGECARRCKVRTSFPKRIPPSQTGGNQHDVHHGAFPDTLVHAMDPQAHHQTLYHTTGTQSPDRRHHPACTGPQKEKAGPGRERNQARCRRATSPQWSVPGTPMVRMDSTLMPRLIRMWSISIMGGSPTWR